MRVNRESFTKCRPFKVFCTNELFVPRVFSDASHDSLASHARRTAAKVCVGGLRLALTFIRTSSPNDTQMHSLLGSLARRNLPINRRKIEPDLREANSRHLDIEGRPQ